MQNRLLTPKGLDLPMRRHGVSSRQVLLVRRRDLPAAAKAHGVPSDRPV